MIRHVNYKLPYVCNKKSAQQIIQKKRCHTTSSHGLFYALFLLIYGMILCHSTSTWLTFVHAESTNATQTVDMTIDETNRAASNKLVSASKHISGHDEVDHHYVDDDEDDEESIYHDLISNKSGETFELMQK